VAALTVLYDGNCALCRASADRLRRLDSGRRIDWVDVREPDVPSRFPQVDREAALRLMQAVDSRGRVYSGVDAYSAIGRALPGWGLAARLLQAPGIHAVAGWIYGWVARNRYRWNRAACADGSCEIHRHP
jgi:predicted DCC family thiol-disulfide oxidoreductase YuxK